ncbi:hypothetical protein [Bradyrhizobium yuanmingense]|uniref:hypothetical protein n=1 Tax=Bradyrhizobium yuanmingense TaxID=108015 RepID=UPI001FEEE8CA|nr:hypothetical protein [Bradyrhizobium yuanmingense]
MKRVILTSSAGVGLALADRADMVVPFIYRFVSGPLPTPDHLIDYLGGRWPLNEMHWSDCVRVHQSPHLRRQDRAGGLLWVCQTYGVDFIELWFDPEPNSQLQLIWILDYLRAEPSLTGSLRLRRVDFNLREADPSELRHRDVRQFDIVESDLGIASMAWEAYRSPTPELCAGLLGRARWGHTYSISGSSARCLKGSHLARRQRSRVWTARWRHSIRTTREVATLPFAGAGCR